MLQCGFCTATQEFADWRLVVVFYLVGYITVQAATRPFKLRHESRLD
jgi:hypothetical protein